MGTAAGTEEMQQTFETPSGTSTKKIRKTLQNTKCVYTRCYCEENVWNLCDEIRRNNLQELNEYYVVFISNRSRQVPLWMQKSSKDPLTPIVWDYHVVLIQKTMNGEKALVYDLDSIMAFPCSFELYLLQVIQNEKQLKKEYHRKFRIIEAEKYLSTFASDRSHMLQTNGEYVKPPPDYPPIRTADEEMNLDDFITMSSCIGEGRVKDLKGFIKFFGA